MATISAPGESITKNTTDKIEYHFFDKTSQPVHKSISIDKKNEVVRIYPFSYNEKTGVKKKRISEIEFRGWSSLNDLPRLLKPGVRVSIGHKKIAPLMRYLYKELPKLRKLVVVKSGGKSAFTQTEATFDLKELQVICREIDREIKTFEDRRKITVQNEMAELSKKFSPITGELKKGALSRFLSSYGNVDLSADDVDTLLGIIANVPLGNVTITENFIETKNRVNVAYLDKVIENFQAYMQVKNDNEKDWQKFFDEHGWILASVFPYQVILRKKEAFVGGKTIENSEGRVVDFLYQNGFKDNYALLEIKTHQKSLMKSTPYRAPQAFAQHEDCSGAISQCLDQKRTFLSEMGQKYSILDPKSVLVIGTRSELSENQIAAFELMRHNLKNVDIVTFDEVLEKIKGLRSILQQ